MRRKVTAPAVPVEAAPATPDDPVEVAPAPAPEDAGATDAAGVPSDDDFGTAAEK